MIFLRIVRSVFFLSSELFWLFKEGTCGCTLTDHGAGGGRSGLTIAYAGIEIESGIEVGILSGIQPVLTLWSSLEWRS